MAISLEPKRSDEQRTYRHDWTPFLETDTISTQTTTATGATIVSSAVDTDGRSITFKVSGGADGTPAIITQHIVSAVGEQETELFILPILTDEVVSLDQAKGYLRILSSDEDAKIAGMIPRARAWVEDYTGLALVQRQFVEFRRTERGAIRLFKGPLVSVDSVTFGNAQTYVPRFFGTDPRLIASTAAAWPILDYDDAFEITYTAGFGPGEVDDRLIGAMLALVEGEYSDGFAYPQRAIDAAERCCGFLRTLVA